MSLHMTGAEFTTRRALTGLSVAELSSLMLTSSTRIHDYEDGRALISDEHSAFMTQLVADHTADMEDLLAGHDPIHLGGSRPTNWYRALGVRIAERAPHRHILTDY